jgi:hypothetical protein
MDLSQDRLRNEMNGGVILMRRRPKYVKKNLFQQQFDHHKSIGILNITMQIFIKIILYSQVFSKCNDVSIQYFLTNPSTVTYRIFTSTP